MAALNSSTVETHGQKTLNSELIEHFKPHPCIKKAEVMTSITESKSSKDVGWWVKDPDWRLARTVLILSKTVETEVGFCSQISWIPKSTELDSDPDNERSWSIAEVRADPMAYFFSKHGDGPKRTHPEIKPGVDYRASRGNFKEMTEKEKQLHLDYLELVAKSYPTCYTKQTTEFEFVKGEELNGKAWYYREDLLIDEDEESIGGNDSIDCIPLVQFEK